MIKIVFLVATVAASALAAPASAQSSKPISAYGTLGYQDATGGGLNLGEVLGRVGVRLGKYIGAEVQGGFGTNTDTSLVDEDGYHYGSHISHSYGAFGVLYYPLASNVDLLARAGYERARFNCTEPGFAESSEGGSWEGGVGVQYFFYGKNGVRLDYMHDISTSDTGDADTFTVSYVRKF